MDYSSRVSNPDSVDDNGILMLGSGKACRKTALKLCQDALGKHLEDFEASRIVWSSNAANFETYEYLLYDRFALGVGEIVHCESYAAPMSRKSFYCIVRYAEDHGEVTYMAKIKFAFRLRKLQTQSILKIAVADLYPAEDACDYLGDYFTVSSEQRPTHVNYPIVISRLGYKVVFANLTKTRTDKLKVGRWIFVPYSHVQSYTDPRA